MKYLLELQGIYQSFEIICLVGGGEEFTLEALDDKEQPIVDYYLAHADEKEIEAILNNIKLLAATALDDAAEMMYDHSQHDPDW